MSPPDQNDCTITVRVPSELRDKFNAAATAQRYSTSDLIRKAMVDFVEVNDVGKKPILLASVSIEIEEENDRFRQVPDFAMRVSAVAKNRQTYLVFASRSKRFESDTGLYKDWECRWTGDVSVLKSWLKTLEDVADEHPKLAETAFNAINDRREALQKEVRRDVDGWAQEIVLTAKDLPSVS
jgi:hypothetical protein